MHLSRVADNVPKVFISNAILLMRIKNISNEKKEEYLYIVC